MPQHRDTGIYPDLVLGGVRFISKLTDEGGQGEVWLASDLNLPRNIAAKVFSWEEDSDEHDQTKAEWDHEAELWARISYHPHVAKLLKYEPHLIHTISETDRRHVKMFVIELAHASLTGAMKANWPPPIETLLRWMYEIADGLMAAHGFTPTPIVHRDVKPSNVLLYRSTGADKFAAITDFGISRWQGEGTSRKWIGTPPYAAPEQHHGHFSPQSDIYGLGMTYLHMLAGKKFRNLLRSRNEMLVFSREAVRTACHELEANPVTVGILDLIEAMTSGARDLTADDVRKHVKTLSRQAEGRQAHIIYQPDDDATSRLRLVANKYLWNPTLHAEFDEALYFFYLRGFMSITNMRTTIATLLDPLLHGRYSLYELFGENDILIRAWVNGGLGTVTDVVRSIGATMSGRCRVLTTKRMRYEWLMRSGDYAITNARKDFIEALRHRDGDDLVCYLRGAKLILGNIECVKPPKVKVFTHITAFRQRLDRNLFDDVSNVLEDSSKMLRRHISGLSTYACYSDQDGESVLVEYHASTYHTTTEVTYMIHERLADLRVRTDSYLAAESSSYQSDDGPFASGHWAQKK